MLEDQTACFRESWNSCLGNIVRFPATIRNAFAPATAFEARNIESQLALARANLRLLNYAYPAAGAILVSLHASRGPVAGALLALVVVIATSAVNELFLLPKRAQSDDAVGRAQENAWTLTLAVFSLMMAWGTFAFSLWAAGGHLLTMLVLACTLAAAGGMFASHAGTGLASIFTLSAFMLALEFVNGYGKHLRLFQLFVAYVTMIVVQACVHHARFNKGWRLEHDRERLIENLRNAKRESDEAHRQAVAANKAKAEFLANMSHELRTPLNAIIGFSDMVRSNALGSTDKYAEYGGYIHQSGHHLLQMISDILELAKMEAGRKVLQPEPVDIASLVLNEIARTEQSASDKGVNVTAALMPNAPLLNADIKALQQILTNLLSNAVKFTPSGGQVEVSVRLNEKREIELCVSDTGIGIDPEQQPYIFDRFGRGPPEIRRTGHGNGLGLPIVTRLSDMHGARLELESELGAGTCIRVIFPATSTLPGRELRVA